MKKIDIVTYCTWTSLGSILQSLGLKSVLTDLGYSSCIWLDNQENMFTRTEIHSVKTAIKWLFEIMIHDKRVDAYQKRMNFISQNLNITYYAKCEELAEKADGDIWLAGSDQIWHPDNCNPAFFLDFTTERRRVSYAASMGVTEVRKEKQDAFSRLLRNFDEISVREQECVPVVRQYTDHSVNVHIDPTFLVSADEWRQYERAYNINEPYILLYMLYWDKSCKDKIKALKKETGLRVFAIANELSSVYADEVFYDVGVEEFLWLIDHAEYVVTSSFHGVAFSVIFNKRFAPVINPRSPSRIENLLRVLEIPHFEIAQLCDAMVFDYQSVNERIKEEKERSIRYLKKVLE